jgi:hypothetical protein
MYAVAINLPRSLGMPTNLMESSSCCISQDISILFSGEHTVILQPLFFITMTFSSMIKCRSILLNTFQNLDFAHMSNSIPMID